MCKGSVRAYFATWDRGRFLVFFGFLDIESKCIKGGTHADKHYEREPCLSDACFQLARVLKWSKDLPAPNAEIGGSLKN